MAPPIKCECGSCRRCKHREYMRGWYRRNAESVRASVRSRQRTPEQRRREYLKLKAKGGPDRTKIAARNAVTHAIERGRMKRGPCEREDEGTCRGRIEGHHDDYSKPLDVRWLCRAHHGEVHRTVAP